MDRAPRQGGGGEGLRFYVYNLQNQRAERLAPLLQQAFTGRVTQPATPAPPTLAPGTPAGHDRQSRRRSSAQPIAPPGDAAAASPPPPVRRRRRRAAPAKASGIVRNMQVVADKDNNTILIVATPAEYSIIEPALRKLDVPPRQVIIEVTIAEVTLTDEPDVRRRVAVQGRRAVRARQRRPVRRARRHRRRSIRRPAAGERAPAPRRRRSRQGLHLHHQQRELPGRRPGGAAPARHLRQHQGRSPTRTSPRSTTRRRRSRPATGSRSTSRRSSAAPTNVVTTTSQYIDTGVLLQVTPHINAGGLVTLDVQAEVSNPGTPARAGERAADQHALGADLRRRAERPDDGDGRADQRRPSRTPPTACRCSSRIPILGGLFGKQELKNNRTELVLFITPRVVETRVDIRGVIDDLRRRMENLDRVLPG